jgi:hypothetical protein
MMTISAETVLPSPQKTEFRLRASSLTRDLRTGLGLCIASVAGILVARYPGPDNSEIAVVLAFCVLPFAAIILLSWAIRRKYRVIIDDANLIVIEPPLRPVIVRWGEVDRVIETKRRNLQFYASTGAIAKVFSDLDQIRIFVAEVRRRVDSTKCQSAENLLRQIELGL